MKKALRILPFITTAALMVLIFCFSAQPSEESAALSSGITRKIVDFFMAGAAETRKEQYAELLHNLIRKIAHFTLYAALGFSASGMFTDKRHMWGYSTLLCLVYAISDELHQITVAGRGPRISDVFIDTAGGAFGAAVFLVLVLIDNHRKERLR